MKKVIFILVSFMFIFSPQGAMATKDAGFLPAMMSLLLDEEGPAPPPSSFDDIHAFLYADCFSCHSDGRRVYQVSADINSHYNLAINQINQALPDQSALLRKPAGLDGHSGGLISADYAVGQSKYELILKWIADGALPPL